MARKLLIDGKPYAIIESLGYCHDVGARAWIVDDDGRERTAIRTTPCDARFWTPADRARPLREALRRHK